MLLIQVGLLWARKEPQERPNMTDVAGMLNQILEIGSSQVGCPSVAELSQQILMWHLQEEPTGSESKSS
jgi:hypothetical protein